MVDKTTAFLKEWAVRYIKNKDVISKKIVSVEESDSSFHVVKNDKEQKFFVIPFLKNADEVFKTIQSYEHSKAVVCFHTKENFDALVTHWKKFVGVGRNLTIYFVNPFSKTERVVIISPYTHDLISDTDSLKQGLKTMAEGVEFTTEEEVKKIVNS
jgi:predicted transcriptional regulator